GRSERSPPARRPARHGRPRAVRLRRRAGREHGGGRRPAADPGHRRHPRPGADAARGALRRSRRPAVGAGRDPGALPAVDRLRRAGDRVRERRRDAGLVRRAHRGAGPARDARRPGRRTAADRPRVPVGVHRWHRGGRGQPGRPRRDALHLRQRELDLRPPHAALLPRRGRDRPRHRLRRPARLL
ncbi:MAG: ABC transporter, substrate-binding protein (cluster 12, methionine/phosphonates), partial [uncultured Nocardioidaceae bacterium]